MADEKSQSGYDDVLSSVRRIVASEVEAATDSGKLLLTPALRVAEPVSEASEKTSGDVEEEATDPNSAQRDYPTLAERIAELEAAVGNTPAEWEPDGSEDQAQHAPNAVVLPLNPAARRHAEADTGPRTNEADLVFAVPGDTESDAPEDELANDAGGDETFSHGSPKSEELTPPGVPVPTATFRHRGQPPAPNEPEQAAGDDPAILDEAALRDLVAEIVREELQGGLGERITRNVRKLVRAEIQRAFAARDLD